MALRVRAVQNKTRFGRAVESDAVHLRQAPLRVVVVRVATPVAVRYREVLGFVRHRRRGREIRPAIITIVEDGFQPAFPLAAGSRLPLIALAAAIA